MAWNVRLQMNTLPWMCDNAKRDNVKNNDIFSKVGIAPIEKNK